MAQTWIDYLNMRINVRQFGAVGDGVTDDTAAIQAAIDAAQAHVGYYSPGGLAVEGWQPVVEFPDGIYVISSALITYQYTKLHGIGQAVIVQSNAGEHILVSTQYRKTEVRNLTFYGGLDQIHYTNTYALEPATLDVSLCKFYAAGGFGVYMQRTIGGAVLRMRDCDGVRCNQFLYCDIDVAIVDGAWISVHATYTGSDRAQIVNKSLLMISGVCGVPGHADSVYGLTNIRWIDNYDRLVVNGCRWGGEFGGIPIVYTFSNAFGATPTWTTATDYEVGDYIKTDSASPIVYRCGTAHTSGATFAADAAYWAYRGPTPTVYADMAGTVCIRDSYCKGGADSRADRGVVVFAEGPPNQLVIEGCSGIHTSAPIIRTDAIYGGTVTLADLIAAMDSKKPNLWISIKNNAGYGYQITQSSSDEALLRPWMDVNHYHAFGASGGNISTTYRRKTYEQHAAGSVYALTATPGLLNFGTTDPEIIITAPGDYLIKAYCKLDYAGATFAANRTVTLKLRRTNNTAADLDNASHQYVTGVVTTVTETFIEVAFECLYTTENTDDNIELWGSIDVVPSAGALNATEAYVMAVRL